jgi:uncharacterized protein (PEP-CTERM system associated)
MKLLMSLALIALPGMAMATTDIKPSIAIKYSVVDVQRISSIDESGQITNLKPALSMVREGPRSSLLLDYSLNAVYNHGLDADDRVVHLLKFLTSYQHIPGKWVSSVGAGSQLTSIDVNGIQNPNPDIIDDNKTELRTFTLDSTITDRVSNTLQYAARVNADIARYSDSTEGTSGRGFRVGLDNQRTPGNFVWSTAVQRQIAGDDFGETRIDTLFLTARYRLNREWSSWVSQTSYDTSLQEFDDSTLLGFAWVPNRRSRFVFGAGRRGDEPSYTMDVVYSLQHLTFSFDYSEDVTTAREDTLERQTSDSLAQPTSQSLSVVPVLLKRTSLNFTARGKYTTLTASAFQTDRSQGVLTSDQLITGVRFRIARALTSRDSLALNLLGQESEDEETNELADLQLSYTHLRSKAKTIDFSLGWTKQNSSDESNEYKLFAVSGQYRVAF